MVEKQPMQKIKKSQVTSLKDPFLPLIFLHMLEKSLELGTVRLLPALKSTILF